MKKRKKFVIIYLIIILVALILIMFVIPDSVFMQKYKNIKLPQIPTTKNEPTTKKEFVDYEIQKENLKKNKYDYEYLLLDSTGSKTYKCTGNINETIESGSCESPTRFSYTESTKTKEFSDIKINYLDPTYIFNLLEDIEAQITEYPTLREYQYTTSIDDLETEIVIYTDLNDITKIELSNVYMTYIIKYSNISY